MSFLRGLRRGLIFWVPEQGSPDAGDIVFINGFQCGNIISLLLFMLLLSIWMVTG